MITSVSSTPAVIRPAGYGSRPASVPLDLSLPRFAAPVAWPKPSLTRWVHKYDTPASPVALSSPSVNLNLDHCHQMGRRDRMMSLLTPISISDQSTQSGDRDQEFSDDETPQSVHVDLIMPASPPSPARVQRFIQTCSPATATDTLSAAASTPISLNRVPGTVDSGLLFQVSPDSQSGQACEFAGHFTDSCYRPPPLGEPVAFDISSLISE